MANTSNSRLSAKLLSFCGQYKVTWKFKTFIQINYRESDSQLQNSIAITAFSEFVLLAYFRIVSAAFFPYVFF